MLNQNITSDIVEKHINKPWDWQMLSNNPNITSDIVEEHNDKPWNWYVIQILLLILLRNISINHGVGVLYL